MTSRANIATKQISYNETSSLNKSSWKKYKPKSTDYYVRDKKLEGFWIRVYKSGKTSYGCYARKGGVGKQIPYTIGACTHWDFETAKGKAREVIHEIRYEGINPKTAIKVEASKNKTLLDLANDYFKDNKKLKENTRDDYVRRMTNRMPSLLKIPVTELTTEIIMDWWHGCGYKSSDRTAFIYARKLMQQAVAKRYILENPFIDAKELLGELPPINQKTTHISKDGMYEFFQSFVKVAPRHGQARKQGQLTNVMRDYLLFALLTGKRRQESASLKWSNVDFANGTITLEKTKSDRIDVVPMTDLLYMMLDYRYHMKGTSNSANKHPMWVFQSPRGDGHITSPDKAFSTLQGELDLNFNLSSHDFRRTFATATRELGLSSEDLNILLNHSKRDVTEGYVQASLEYKRKNLNAVSNYYNQESNFALNEMMVFWYDGNQELFIPDGEESKPAKMDFKTSRMYLLGRYEKDFDGIGSGKKGDWKPNKKLKDAGWIDIDD